MPSTALERASAWAALLAVRSITSWYVLPVNWLLHLRGFYYPNGHVVAKRDSSTNPFQHLLDARRLRANTHAFQGVVKRTGTSVETGADHSRKIACVIRTAGGYDFAIYAYLDSDHLDS